jgi:hypothetical protein
MPTIAQCIANNEQRIAALKAKRDNTRPFLQSLLDAQRDALGPAITKLEKEWQELFLHIPAQSEGK